MLLVGGGVVSVVVVVWEGGFGAFCTNFGGQSANMSLGIASGPGVIVRCFAEPYVAMYRARAVSCLSLVVRARAFFFYLFVFCFLCYLWSGALLTSCVLFPGC